tara:strand:+ start:378 stop:716 length:339 start_codon:yes stop_codon:yes gene_type:complete
VNPVEQFRHLAHQAAEALADQFCAEANLPRGAHVRTFWFTTDTKGALECQQMSLTLGVQGCLTRVFSPTFHLPGGPVESLVLVVSGPLDVLDEAQATFMAAAPSTTLAGGAQ